MPTSKVTRIVEGAFHGFVPSAHRASLVGGWAPADDWVKPLVWMPHAGPGSDNSPSQARVIENPAWPSELQGDLLLASYGRGTLSLLLMEEVDGQPQAAHMTLPLQFRSGLQQMRFHRDGHLYLVGMTNWSSTSHGGERGALHRVRYTAGKPLHMPVALNTRPGGLELRFAEPLDRASATHAANYRLFKWTYTWNSSYGSKQFFSLDKPGQAGPDSVVVQSAILSADGRTLLLEIPSLTPGSIPRIHITGTLPHQIEASIGMIMQIDYDIRAADGAQLTHLISKTLHRVPGDHTTSHGKATTTTSTPAPAEAHTSGAPSYAAPSVTKPEPKAMKDLGRVVAVRTEGLELSYEPALINARAGETLTIRYDNVGEMTHNIVVVRSDQDVPIIGEAAFQAAFTNNWIPSGADHAARMIAYTPLAGPKETVEVTFTVPPPGEYPFICTYASHWTVMRGRLIVAPAILRRRNMKRVFGVLMLLASGMATLDFNYVAADNSRPTTPVQLMPRLDHLPSFPGAEGHGSMTRGGRGGQVIAVTNLNDSGPGSLRAAVEAGGPRIVIFKVSGTIDLKSTLSISNPYITIAGQTAPGDGIAIKRYPVTIDADEVILRYLRVRLGAETGDDVDAISSRYHKNIMVDHVSASWSVDETLSIYHCENVTVQWSLISESLYKSVHEKGAHGFGGIWGCNYSTYHHNLLAHHSSRNPRFASGAGHTDYRNNVIYNWGNNSAYGGEKQQVGNPKFNFTTINMVANYYKPGPATGSGPVKHRIVSPSSRDGANDFGRWYVADNYMDGNPTVTADNWAGGVQPQGGDTHIKALRLTAPWEAMPIRQQTAEEAYRVVLQHAGVSLPGRDAIDARIVEEVRTGTAKFGESYGGGGKGIIDSQNAVGGWPELTSRAAPPDTDGDGMPDAWEIRYRLDAHDPADGSKDLDGDGYTNVEEWLNATDPTVFVDYKKPENNVNTLHSS